MRRFTTLDTFWKLESVKNVSTLSFVECEDANDCLCLKSILLKFNWKLEAVAVKGRCDESIWRICWRVNLMPTQCQLWLANMQQLWTFPNFIAFSELLWNYSSIFEACSISKMFQLQFQPIIPLSNDFNMLPLTSCRVTSIEARHKTFPKFVDNIFKSN